MTNFGTNEHGLREVAGRRRTKAVMAVLVTAIHVGPLHQCFHALDGPDKATPTRSVRGEL